MGSLDEVAHDQRRWHAGKDEQGGEHAHRVGLLGVHWTVLVGNLPGPAPQGTTHATRRPYGSTHDAAPTWHRGIGTTQGQAARAQPHSRCRGWGVTSSPAPPASPASRTWPAAQSSSCRPHCVRAERWRQQSQVHAVDLHAALRGPPHVVKYRGGGQGACLHRACCSQDTTPTRT